MQQDLNDFYYFVHVVDHGGFTQAGKAINTPKSKLSRRIALLEERLGTRLIQRSTRSFSVTPIGEQFYTHCKAMLVEAEAAQSVIESSHSEPCGILRMTCPIALIHAHVGRMVIEFMHNNPKVNVELLGLNRSVDVVTEGIDLAIRVRPLPLEDSDLAMRALGYASQCLVASPQLLKQHSAPSNPIELAALPSIGFGPSLSGQTWKLIKPDGAQASQHHNPHFVSTDMLTLRDAAVADMGVVQLPVLILREQLKRGELVQVLPDWSPRREMIHAVFPSRRGLLPSVRTLLDHLASAFETVAED
ncbi:MAG: LysR family transcriptional regulator [Parahaliea sp.]